MVSYPRESADYFEKTSKACQSVQAVSDTGVIRAEAEINYYVSQVEVISYIESMLLGDPFNFLSNWPTFVWLRRFPSCR